MKKGIVVLISLLSMALPLPLQACQEASRNNFEVLSLNVTPAKVIVNEKFTVIADINSTSKNEMSYTIPIMVNGIADDRTTLTLAPGKSQEVQFILHKSKPGSYEVGIGSKTAVVTVEEPLPASFKLSDLNINLEEANPGEEIIMVALLSNTGGTEGEYAAELKVNDTVEQSQKVTMPPGTNYNLVFKITKNDPGIYNVAVGDLTGKFTVLEPVKVIQVTAPPETPYKRVSQRQPCCGGGVCP